MKIFALQTRNESSHSAVNLGPSIWRGLVAGAGLEHPRSPDKSDLPRADFISGPGNGKMECASRGQENALEFLNSHCCPGTGPL